MNEFLKACKHGCFELVNTVPADWHLQPSGHWYRGTGWYFMDEAQLLVGAYNSKLDAQIAYYFYCMHLTSDSYADEIADAEAGHPHPATELMFVVYDIQCTMRIHAFNSYEEAVEYIGGTDGFMIEVVEEDEDLAHTINR